MVSWRKTIKIVIKSVSLILLLSACKNVFTDLERSHITGDNEIVTPVNDSFPSLFKSSVPLQTGGAANLAHRHTCGVTNDGNVLCWGSNPSGQLGDGTFDDKTTPTLVVGGDQGGTHLEDITHLSTGHSHTCAIDESQRVYCWGIGGTVLGQGVDVPNSNIPLLITTGEQGSASGFLEGATSIGTGFGFTCALTNEKRVYCWGTRNNIGYGSATDSNAPIIVVAGEQGSPSGYLENIRQIGVGYRTTCVVSETDEPFCWGNGQGTGIGSTARQYAPVRPLSGQQGAGVHLVNVKQITSGWNRSCAVTNDDALYCWGTSGDDFGHDGSPADTPVRVLAGEQTVGNDGVYLGNVKQIEGTDHYCAITYDGQFFCWGLNMSRTPAKVSSDEFEAGFVSNVENLSLNLQTTWFFDEQGRPFGTGFSYHSTFLDQPDGFYTDAFFLDLVE